MFVIYMNHFPEASIEQFFGGVRLLANHIREGGSLVHERALGVLRGLEQEFSNTPPSLEVIEDLGKIITIAKEKGLSKKLQEQIQIIKEFRKKIIALRTPDLPKDVIEEVLSQLSIIEAQKFQRVSKTWWRASPRAQIRAINESKRRFYFIFPKNNATEILNWLEKNPAHQELEFANFSYVSDFDNACLQRLTNLCPNLIHLNLIKSAISGDALKHLAHTKNLQFLRIDKCNQLERDALKHLEHTNNLQSLDIANCNQLERDALKHLVHTKNLLSLNIDFCSQLEPNIAKYLVHTMSVRHLNLRGCDQLDFRLIRELFESNLIKIKYFMSA